MYFHHTSVISAWRPGIFLFIHVAKKPASKSNKCLNKLISLNEFLGCDLRTTLFRLISLQAMFLLELDSIRKVHMSGKYKSQRVERRVVAGCRSCIEVFVFAFGIFVKDIKKFVSVSLYNFVRSSKSHNSQGFSHPEVKSPQSIFLIAVVSLAISVSFLHTPLFLIVTVLLESRRFCSV